MTLPQTAPTSVLTAALVALACSCATPQQSRREPTSDDPRQDAARLAAEAPLEQRRALVDELEVRIRNVSADGLSDGDGVETALRVPLNNPWEMSADARVWEAQSATAWTEFDRRQLAVQTERCHQGVASAERDALWAVRETWLDAAGELERWGEELAAADGLDQLAAAELKLDLTLEQTRNRPAPAASAADGTLPRLVEPNQRLTTDADAIGEQIATHHPGARREETEVELARAREERADAERIPWLDFGEVSYGIGSGDGAGAIQFQLSMIVPLGIAAGAEADRYDAEARGGEQEHTGFVLQHVKEARPLLTRLDDFEQQIPDLLALRAATDDAEVVADTWLSERIGDPKRIANVYHAILRARVTIVERQVEAATDRCDLLEVTGVAIEDWPRQ